MAGASEVRAGAAFIEIRADDSQFQRSVKSVHNRFAMVGQSLRRIGSQLAAAGVAMGVPLVLAATHAARFEDALLELQASVSDLRPDQLKRVREEALRMSKEMGVAPERIAEAFTLLVKAGMSVEDALNGAAKTAVEFARISGVSAQEAATFMKVAMNVFGGSAAAAADTLSAAADASETDLRHMVEAFGLVGSAGKTFDQTLFDISQGFAVLARYGIQGEEAGTGIKVMLQRLIAPSREAEKALARVGFSITNFRDTEGRMLPLVQIVGVLAKRLETVDKITRDQVLDQVFGDRGVRVVGAFLDMGVEGFDDLATAMERNLPVSEKFRIVMSGLTGLGERLVASVRRLAIALTSSFGDGLRVAGEGVARLIDGLSWMLEKFPFLGKVFGVVAGLAFVVGAAMLVVAGAIAAVTFSLRTILGGLSAVTKFGPKVLATGAAFGRWAVFLAEMVSAIGFAKTGLLVFEHLFGAWGLFISEMIQSAGLAQTATLLLEHVVENLRARLSSLATMMRPALDAISAMIKRLLSSQAAMRALELGTLASGKAFRMLRNAMIAVEAVGWKGLLAGAAGSAASKGKGIWEMVKTIGIGGTLMLGLKSATSWLTGGMKSLGSAIARVGSAFGPWGKGLAIVLAIGAGVFAIKSDLQDLKSAGGLLSNGWLSDLVAGTSQSAAVMGARFAGAKNPNVNRSTLRDPMSEPGDGMQAATLGKSVGTFSADAAMQLGIGPDASAANATATNTGRTADATEELVRRSSSPPPVDRNAPAAAIAPPPADRALPAASISAPPQIANSIPPAANLRAGLSNARNGVAPTAPAGWDRDMLSAAERTALAVEAAIPILRNLLTATKSMSPAFG